VATGHEGAEEPVEEQTEQVEPIWVGEIRKCRGAGTSVDEFYGKAVFISGSSSAICSVALAENELFIKQEAAYDRIVCNLVSQKERGVGEITVVLFQPKDQFRSSSEYNIKLNRMHKMHIGEVFKEPASGGDSFYLVPYRVTDGPISSLKLGFLFEEGTIDLLPKSADMLLGLFVRDIEEPSSPTQTSSKYNNNQFIQHFMPNLRC